MKKNIIFILVGLGVLIVVIAAFLMARSNKNKDVDIEEEETIVELPQTQWPAITLTPTSDPKAPNSLGHFLDFRIQKINVPNASTLDYLLVYNTSDGGQQGVPGTIKITGTEAQRTLLLGSESSGKFRFDAGVSEGTMTLTFRDAKGKSLGRISSDFHLQSGVTELTSVDGSFKYTLDKVAKGVYFVTVKTLAEPQGVTTVVWRDGYGVYSSDGLPHAGN